MKKTIGLLFTLGFLSTMVFFPSCNKKDATMGNLHINIIDSLGNTISGAQVQIATSRQNEIQGVYIKVAGTDASGIVTFIDLLPGYYWYGVSGWKDHGAVDVYAGIDQYVYLMLNSPILPKK